MPIHYHTCSSCEATTELDISFDAYDKLEKEFGRGDTGGIRFPCDQDDCEGWSERDYSFGIAHSVVKGGKLFSKTSYRADAEHEWLRKEIKETKNTLLGKKGEGSDYNTQRPYVGYTLDDKAATDMGFKRCTPEEAKARAETSKKTTGDEVAGVDKARKRTDIED